MTEYRRETRRAGRKLTEAMLAEASASLTEIEWRLLHWLLHYPLQRVDDLVVGVARWASRATVYRHMHVLETRGLVESVLPKMPGTGKRLYHLSNLGLYVLATSLETPARELAHSFQADEAGLLRLLPRLPTWLQLQEMVNELVTRAAEVMTTQGRRPQLVRWTWQREITHRFQYREKMMRFFADGAVALCVRAQQSDGSALDEWYGAFLLFTELDDERLMRLRLERLLCWRESPERWPVYQHMLPVLILVAFPHQRDHWQRAVETSALKLRLDPLHGAITALLPSEKVPLNPWRLPWRTLSTDHPCRLPDLLRPVPPAAFLPALGVEHDEIEGFGVRSPSHGSVSSGPAERPTRLVVGNLAKRVATIRRSDREERESIALLALRLTPCHWSALRLLLAHPLLSDEELAGLLALQRKSARSSLYTLRALGCLEPISTPAGRRWHLCERGLRLIAAANHLSLQSIALWSDDGARSTLVQRGKAGSCRTSSTRLGSMAFSLPWRRQRDEHQSRRSTGGKSGPRANGTTGWENSGTISGRTPWQNTAWGNDRSASGWSGIAAP